MVIKKKRVNRIWQIWDGLDCNEAYNGTIQFGYLGLDQEPTVAIRQYEDEPVLLDRNELFNRLKEMIDEENNEQAETISNSSKF